MGLGWMEKGQSELCHAMKGQRRTHDLASRAVAKVWEGEGKREGLGPKARGRQGEGQRSVLEDNLLAMRTLIVGDVPPDMNPPDTVLSVLFILPAASPTSSSCSPCGLQEGWVWAPGSLIDQDVQGLLKDPGFWKFHLGLLLLRSIDNGGTAHLGDFAALPVERPAADLVPQDILEEEQPPVEAQGQLVEQLDVLK